MPPLPAAAPARYRRANRTADARFLRGRSFRDWSDSGIVEDVLDACTVDDPDEAKAPEERKQRYDEQHAALGSASSRASHGSATTAKRPAESVTAPASRDWPPPTPRSARSARTA